MWEPDPHTPRASITTTWIFDLRGYRDALDHGQQTTHDWERRQERLAQELRTERDSLFGFFMMERDTRARVRLLDATAWPATTIFSSLSPPEPEYAFFTSRSAMNSLMLSSTKRSTS